MAYCSSKKNLAPLITQHPLLKYGNTVYSLKFLRLKNFADFAGQGTPQNFSPAKFQVHNRIYDASRGWKLEHENFVCKNF